MIAAMPTISEVVAACREIFRMPCDMGFPFNAGSYYHPPWGGSKLSLSDSEKRISGRSTAST
jgi:hypothetical protein